MHASQFPAFSTVPYDTKEQATVPPMEMATTC